MFNLIEKVAKNNGITVQDFVEAEKKRLIPYLPDPTTCYRLIGTLHAMCVRYTDLLIKRYDSLENAIAAGEKGEAFIAQAIKARGNTHGGMVGWVKKYFPRAAFSHPKVAQARDIMQDMGVLNYDSNGHGNVGYTRINVPSILVLTALLEDVLGMKPDNTEDATALAHATYMGFTDEEMAERIETIEESIEQPEYAVPPIAKIMKSRCKNFFGYNLRSKDAEYRYPAELETFIQEAWAAIAKVAQPVINIPVEFLNETVKYCKEGAKRVIKRTRYLARTLKNELAYQADLDTPF